ncbi:MAG: UDP-3-O-acyl-N-acetylglucosamine deacetylase [Pseudomonadota bacterium]
MSQITSSGYRRQTTVAEPVCIDGTALHSGDAVSLRLVPAKAGSGFVFLRTDLGYARIPARVDRVVETRLGTCIADENGASMKTIEHMLAAFVFAGIDNADIEINGPEPPILDGSAHDIMILLDRAGRRELDISHQPMALDDALELQDADRYIRYEPSDDRILTVTIEFADSAIGKQTVVVDLDDEDFVRQRLAPARTFCRRADIDAMRSAGLARGGSLENAIVVDGDKILNDGGLRDPKEFALHKALDVVGDLALIGAEIRGRIAAHKPGHDLNTAFARKFVDRVQDGALTNL